jgi:hypothetical protein
MVEKGLPRVGPGALTLEEAKQLHNCSARARQGSIPDPSDIPEVVDQEAKQRIGNWLTNLSRSDVSDNPHDLFELGGVSLLADEGTVASVRLVYDLYIRSIFGFQGEEADEIVSSKIDDLHELQRAIGSNASKLPLGSFLDGGRILVIARRPIEFENICILPNLVSFFLIDDSLARMEANQNGLILIRESCLKDIRRIDDLQDLVRLSDQIGARGKRVESLWLP